MAHLLPEFVAFLKGLLKLLLHMSRDIVSFDVTDSAQKVKLQSNGIGHY